MNKFDLLPDRALDLASQAGDALRHLGPKASSLISTGAKLGAVRTGARLGLAVVRRNPVIAVATLAGAGLLWYAAKRRASRAENGEGATIEGTARRVEARKGKSGAAATKSRSRAASGSRARKASTRSAGTSSNETRTEH